MRERRGRSARRRVLRPRRARSARRPPRPRARRNVQSSRASKREHIFEEFGRKARFVAAQPDADNAAIREFRGDSRRSHRRLRPEISRYIENQSKRRATLFVQRRCDRANRLGDIQLRMEERPHRRRDEQLAVHDVLRECIARKLFGETHVIRRLSQRAAHRRKGQQELAEVSEAINMLRIARSGHFLARTIAGRYAVAFGEFEKSLSPKSAFKVAMEVDFG